MIKKLFKNTVAIALSVALLSNSVSAITFIDANQNTDTDTTPPEVVLPDNTTNTEQGALDIVDHDVENSVFDPWDDQEAEITFTINKAAVITMEIRDEDNEEIETLVDKRSYDAGEYTIRWDGEDLFGDLVDDDEYKYRITARNDTEVERVTGRIFVKRGYESDDNDDTVVPRLKRVYITKEEFDPGIKEKNYIVFTLTSEADVKGVILDDDENEIYDFVDKNDLSAGTYSFKLDSDELANEKGDLEYKITAHNSRGSDSAEGKFEVVEENDREDNKPNVYKDYSDEIPFNPLGDEHMAIKFKTDRTSEVTIEIRDDDFLLKTIVDETDLDEGSHTIYWDGRDKDGDIVGDGIYNYKITAENNRGKDTEYGNFSVEDSYSAINTRSTGDECAGFVDVSSSNEFCDAIEWAKSHDVIHGFDDNSMRPQQPVTRAQAIKMVLEALKINLLEAHGDNLGFTDIYRYAWYMDYLKTAFSLGVVRGYGDGTFKPNQFVLRAEGFIMLINAAQAKDSVIIPSRFYGQPFLDVPNNNDTRWYISEAWFAKDNGLTNDEHYFYPLDYMTRGEVVDMLYRYQKAAL